MDQKDAVGQSLLHELKGDLHIIADLLLVYVDQSQFEVNKLALVVEGHLLGDVEDVRHPDAAQEVEILGLIGVAQVELLANDFVGVVELHEDLVLGLGVVQEGVLLVDGVTRIEEHDEFANVLLVEEVGELDDEVEVFVVVERRGEGDDVIEVGSEDLVKLAVLVA